MQETLVLSDASLEDAVLDVLASLHLDVDYSVEWAMDYPGQQLAVDLHAATEGELRDGVERVREALAERLGVDARSSADVDRDIRLGHTA